MSILKTLTRARLDYHKEHGKFPKRLVVCSCTLKQIKTALYPNITFDVDSIPLKRYDGMVIEEREEEGWELVAV